MSVSALSCPAKELAPDPGVLLRSLRSIGYSVEDAVADIVDNSLSAGAAHVSVTTRDRGHDVTVDIADDGTGLDHAELEIALTLGSSERDPGKSRDLGDLGRFGLGLKTASFSVAERLALLGKRNGVLCGAAWDLASVTASGKWLLASLGSEEERELVAHLEGKQSGTVVRWSRTSRLGVPAGAGRAGWLATLEERLRKHLGMVYHRYLDGLDAEGSEIERIALVLNGREVRGWNPLVPLTERPELVQFGEVRNGHGLRVEYAVLPPDVQLLEEEREQTTLLGRRMTEMQGFYVYRCNRLVSFASWLSLPGTGRGRWSKEPSTQLARVAVDLTNSSDEEWGLDVRKSRVLPPERVRPVLVEVGTEARALSRSRIFGRTKRGSAAPVSPLPSLWSLGQGRLQINREHPLVSAVVSPPEGASVKVMRAAVRSLLRQLEASPSLAALLSEPASRISETESAPAVLDDADITDAVDLGRCLLRSGTRISTVLEVAAEDPRFRNDPALMERLRVRLEREQC